MRKAGVGAAAVVLLAVLVFLARVVVEPSTRRGQGLGAADQLSAQRPRADVQDRLPVLPQRRPPLGVRRASRRSSGCMGCHKITAADKPEIKKLAEYAAKQRADPVDARVQAARSSRTSRTRRTSGPSVRCQTCHGPVETMTTVGATTGPQPRQRPAAPRPACARRRRRSPWAGASTATASRTPTRKTKAPLDCVTCHH